MKKHTEARLGEAIIERLWASGGVVFVDYTVMVRPRDTLIKTGGNCCKNGNRSKGRLSQA